MIWALCWAQVPECKGTYRSTFPYHDWRFWPLSRASSWFAHLKGTFYRSLWFISWQICKADSSHCPKYRHHASWCCIPFTTRQSSSTVWSRLSSRGKSTCGGYSGNQWYTSQSLSAAPWCRRPTRSVKVGNEISRCQCWACLYRESWCARKSCSHGAKKHSFHRKFGRGTVWFHPLSRFSFQIDTSHSFKPIFAHRSLLLVGWSASYLESKPNGFELEALPQFFGKSGILQIQRTSRKHLSCSCQLRSVGKSNASSFSTSRLGLAMLTNSSSSD